MKPQLPALHTKSQVVPWWFPSSLEKVDSTKHPKTNFSQNLKVSKLFFWKGLWDPFQTAGPSMAPISGVPIQSPLTPKAL